MLIENKKENFAKEDKMDEEKIIISNNLQKRKKPQKNSFKILAQSALRHFTQCYSIFILSNLSNSLMLPEKSAYEKLCIFIEEREDDNNFSYLDLKIYDMFNKYSQSIFKFFNEDLADYLITNIWSGLFLVKKSQNFEANKIIIFKTFTNLLYFREVGLINSVLHLLYDKAHFDKIDQNSILFDADDSADQTSELIESCFIRLVAYSRLDNRKRFIKQLNCFINIISNVDLENEAKVKFNFVNFYAGFLNSQSDYISDSNKNLVNPINKGVSAQSVLEPSCVQSLNFKLLAFYLLEEFLNKKYLLNGELKFDFYYNSFNFIFPLIKSKSAVAQIANLNSLNNNNNNNNFNNNFSNIRNQKFLLDFLNSCLQVDFDLSLTFYLSIINEVYSMKDLNDKMLGLFVEYIIDYMKKPKNAQFFPRNLIPNANVNSSNQPAVLNLENNLEPNFSNNFLIEKIILSDSRLLVSICKYLENQCLEAKSNKKLCFYFGIKESLLKENLSNMNMDMKMSLNVFYLLHKIYSDMKDFHNAARISLLYSEALDDLIKGNVLSLDEMVKVFTEKNITLQNLAYSLKRIENKQSAIYLLKMKKLNSPNTRNL